MRLLRPLACRLVPALALALPLAACGGGGGNGGDPGTQNVDKTIILPVALDFTGSMRDTGEYGDTSIDGLVLFGDDVAYGADHEVRGFLSFELAGIPAGAVIKTATIHVDARVRSGNPFGNFGLPVVEWLSMGPGISTDDFTTTYTGTAPFSNVTNAAAFQPVSFEVTNQVRDDYLAAHAIASFRARFVGSPVQDNTVAEVAIQVSQIDPAARPYLEVVYR